MLTDLTQQPMNTLTPLAKLTIPIGGQVIELQQLDYEAGGMSLLRTRIREKAASPCLTLTRSRPSSGARPCCAGRKHKPQPCRMRRCLHELEPSA